MKNRISLLFASLSLMFVFGISLMAQEKTEVTVQVKKEGKVVKDTTYQFEDEAEAKHAIQMMEVLSGEKRHTEIRHLEGDSLVWISEGDHPRGEHVVIVKSGDGETFDILNDEDEDGKQVVKKEVTVIVSGDELHEADENVYIIEGDDDLKVEMKKIMEEYDGVEGARVKVIVIKKNGDHHENEVEVEVIEKKKKK